MNCEALLSGALPKPHDAGSAARFAELLQTCKPASTQDQYLAPPTVPLQPPGPLLEALSRIDQLELPQPASAASQGDADPAAAFADVAETALQTQKEILRTVIMMETMNSAKQGVTTLFQLQG